MKTFDSDIVSALSAETAALFWLLKLEFADTYHYTDCDIDLRYGTATYTTRAFEIGSVVTSADLGVDSIEIGIDNRDLVMSATVLGEDIGGSMVTLSLCAISSTPGMLLGVEPLKDTLDVDLTDTADEILYGTGADAVGYLHPVAVENLFIGLVNNWTLGEDQLQLHLVTEMALWKKRTLRSASASCPWEFKNGVECPYAGAANWCDQTFSRCSALGMTVYFGGFRWLPSIQEANIWWGSWKR